MIWAGALLTWVELADLNGGALHFYIPAFAHRVARARGVTVLTHKWLKLLAVGGAATVVWRLTFLASERKLLLVLPDLARSRFNNLRTIGPVRSIAASSTRSKRIQCLHQSLMNRLMRIRNYFGLTFLLDCYIRNLLQRRLWPLNFYYWALQLWRLFNKHWLKRVWVFVLILSAES
jgi:hypothetical protein